MGKNDFPELSMKKKVLACLALALPFALTACTTVSNLTLNANWYSRTDTTISGNQSETLEYTVDFESSEDNAYLSYAQGSYTTVLNTENMTLADGGSDTGYHLVSTLRIPVTYTVGDETETFEDVVTSEVWFRDTRHELRPVRSVKTVLSHSPLAVSDPESIEDVYIAYDYTFTTSYDVNCTQAEISIEYRSEVDGETQSSTENHTVELSGAGTYFDNEQILFSLRAIDPTLGVTFRSINPVRLREETLSAQAAAVTAPETLTFSINGEAAAEHEVNANSFSIGYTGTNSGLSQSYTYAALTDAANNTYRNVLLRMDVPVLHSLGTLHYRLVSAQFIQ